MNTPENNPSPTATATATITTTAGDDDGDGDDKHKAAVNTPENNHSPAITAGDDDGDGDDELEKVSEEFLCCVCLDLIYKPVVLACGHMSCFWCACTVLEKNVQFRCPICRHPLDHLPHICWLLHSVLLKLYPKTYRRRESQVMEEEKKNRIFSTEFEKYLVVLHSSEQMASQSHAIEHGKNCMVKEPLEPAPSDNNCTAVIPTSLSDEITKSLAVKGNCSSGGDHFDKCYKQAAITDLLCAICKELLYRPVVLNCGHVFCEACIRDSSNEPCQCPVCQSKHPKGFPKVCLVLVGFLEKCFSEEYAARRVAMDKLGICEQGRSSTGSSQFPQGGNSTSVPMRWCYFASLAPSHLGIGCDFCGMYPLAGKRYKCKDCLEDIGFDLCGECHNSSSNLPGRFNQQHKPDHEFEVIQPSHIIVTFHSTESPEDLPPIIFETLTNASTSPNSSLDTQQDPETDVAGTGPTNDTLDDHEDNGPTL